VQGTAQTTVALIGRFGIAASFNMIFLYTTELFPTIVRSAALGTCSLVARFGGIAAPQIILLRRLDSSIPSIIFGVFAILGMLAAALLPETKGVVIADDLEGAAKQAKGRVNERTFVALETEEDEPSL
jgi:MFS transporter, OCT family, solute carrier family 22 (organic cation transporter), member 4/5